MLSGGSQLAFRALWLHGATDQKWAWSVSRQNTHRNHFKEAWIMHEALRQLLRAVLTCHRWSVHRISGGLVVPSCCVASGCVSWAAGVRGDWDQSCISGSGSSAHWEHGCTELSRATSGESKGTGLLSMQMQCSLYSRVKQLQAGEVLSCCGTFPGANKNLK